ncbi:MAG: heme exporter protein CcmD [Zoogloeaceae bacterium]|jgi:heme exporter protein CcmD|nr:heme exporter protein CcmD [Zoogloeaceae bacterium]
MYWHSFSDFLRMGEHGLYVWSSLGMVALLMVLESWWVRRRLRLVRRRLADSSRTGKAERPPAAVLTENDVGEAARGAQ